MGSVTGTVVDYEAVTTSDYGYSTIRDLTLRLTLKGGELYPLLGEGLSVGDTLRIVQCDGEEKEEKDTTDNRELQELLFEINNVYGGYNAFAVWRVSPYIDWVCGRTQNCREHPFAYGKTPLEAAQNLLEKVKRQKGLRVDPHGEGWDADKCREWLDERGRLEEGATLLWRFEAALYERKGSGDCIAYRSNKSRLEALRDLVVAVNEKQQEAK